MIIESISNIINNKGNIGFRKGSENMIEITYNDKNFTKENLFIQNMKYMFNRLQSMFVYKGLPKSIPEQELEGILFKYGTCFITEVNETLYAFPYSPVDELDVYGNFTKVNVNNVALNLSRVFKKEEGVICDNDFMRLGLFPIMSKYSELLAENTITIKNTDILLRMTSLISASDNVTKQSAEHYLEKLRQGEIAIIGESPFFNGIKVSNSSTGLQNYLHQFLELQQYLKGSFFNELGLNANFNLTNKALGANETALNRDFLHPLVDNMKECREIFIQELNKKYNLNITVEFNSSWKLEEDEALHEFDSELNKVTLNAKSTKKEGINHVDTSGVIEQSKPKGIEEGNSNLSEGTNQGGNTESGIQGNGDSTTSDLHDETNEHETESSPGESDLHDETNEHETETSNNGESESDIRDDTEGNEKDVHSTSDKQDNEPDNGEVNKEDKEDEEDKRDK